MFSVCSSYTTQISSVAYHTDFFSGLRYTLIAKLLIVLLFFPPFSILTVLFAGVGECWRWRGAPEGFESEKQASQRVMLFILNPHSSGDFIPIFVVLSNSGTNYRCEGCWYPCYSIFLHTVLYDLQATVVR